MDQNSDKDSAEQSKTNSAATIEVAGELVRLLAADDRRELIEHGEAFEFPVTETLRLLADRYVREGAFEEAQGRTALLAPPDLYEQLADGKLVLATAQIASHLPMHLIYRAALDDDTPVVMPLPDVVGWIGLDSFRRRTPGVAPDFDIEGMDDPFPEEDAITAEDRGASSAAASEAPATQEPLAIIPIADVEPSGAEGAVAVIQDIEEPADAAASLAGSAPPPFAFDRLIVPASEAEPARTDEAVADRAAARSGDESPVVEDVGEEPVLEAAASAPGEDAPPLPAVSEPVPDAGTEETIAYPLSVAMTHLPEDWVASDAEAPGPDETVMFEVPALFEQLSRGSAEVGLGTLAIVLPRALLSEQAHAGDTTPVRLDLSMVVRGVGIEALVERTPETTHPYDIERMVDPFEEPDVLPPFVKPRKKPAGPAPSAAPTDRGELPPPPDAPTYISRQDSEAELAYREFPGNVNINAAPIEELLTLPGMTEPIAQSIISYRTSHGGFDTIFEIQKLSLVDSTLFRQLTGLKSERKRGHRGRLLARLLKVPARDVTNLLLVARAVTRRSGFRGCLIADEEGRTLARAGMDEFGDNLGAVMPRMIRQIRRNMELAGADRVDAVTVASDGVLYTITSATDVFLAAVHEESYMNEAALSFTRRVARELGWLLSLRAYVGPRLPADKET